MLVLGLEEHRLGDVVEDRVRLARREQRSLGEPDRERRLCGDPVGQPVARGLQVSRLDDSASTEPAGTVTDYSPKGPAPSGTTVTITVSTFVPEPTPPAPDGVCDPILPDDPDCLDPGDGVTPDGRQPFGF